MLKKNLSSLISVVIVIRNQELSIIKFLKFLHKNISEITDDFEIVLVDNHSEDGTVNLLQEITSFSGLSNLQVFVLADEVDKITASWVGIENSIGDLVICLENNYWNIEYVYEIAKNLESGNEIVFTNNLVHNRRYINLGGIVYNLLNSLLRIIIGTNLNYYSTSLLGINRRVINYILQFDDPITKYRCLPTIAGFKRKLVITKKSLNYKDKNLINLSQSIFRGINIITSTSYKPLRLVSIFSFFGANFSVFYSLYVLIIWISKKDIAQGWVSTSIQISIMFFILSCVLIVISEYILAISRKVYSGPKYFIANEFISNKLSRENRLNIEIDKMNKNKNDF